jgi:hypothetical protein
MTVSGPITASSLIVTGSVTMSSVTVSSITVADLNVLGSATGLGRIVQMQFSSTTVETDVSTTTFQPVPDMAKAITLSNAANYVRISLTGTVASASGGSTSAYLTIMRDSTDLGNTVNNTGLAAATTNSSSGVATLYEPTGITIADSPGDTNSHTYQVYIRTSSTTGVPAAFTAAEVGYLLLEEIHL